MKDIVAVHQYADPNDSAASLGAPSVDDWAFCAAVLPRVSRTFALSIGALPSELRNPVRIAYLLCRIVDTIEDEHRITGQPRAHLFDLFDGLMANDGVDPAALQDCAQQCDLGAGSEDQELCLQAGAVFRCFRALPNYNRGAIRPHVQEMSRGMRQFCTRADKAGKLRLSSMDDLERYCYFVAGTVGKLLTALFEHHFEEAGEPLDEPRRLAIRGRAISFGLGLQLVNIVKDVAEDLPRGDCFLPMDLASSHGLALEQILDPDKRAAGLAVVRAVCARAREHLDRAREYVLLWPTAGASAIRFFCSVPLALALSTLHEVEHGSDTLVTGRTPKISRSQVGAIFLELEQAAGDDARLRLLLEHAATSSAPAAASTADEPPPVSSLR